MTMEQRSHDRARVSSSLRAAHFGVEHVQGGQKAEKEKVEGGEMQKGKGVVQWGRKSRRERKGHSMRWGGKKNIYPCAARTKLNRR